MTTIELEFLPPPAPKKRSRKADLALVAPFVILFDTQEQAPFSFREIRADAAHEYRLIQVQMFRKSLGAQKGDYTILGHEPYLLPSVGLPGEKGFTRRISIERKSVEDAHGTILGWSGHSSKDARCGCHRCRFERELELLDSLDFSAVVVESSWGEFLRQAPEWGKKTAAQNRSTLFNSVTAWQQRYRSVQWCFCDGRQLAEETTYRHLDRFWNETKELEAVAKQVAS